MIKKFVAFSNMTTDEKSDNNKLIRIVMRAEHAFRKYMDNDFDTPRAVEVVVKLSEDLSQFAKHGEKISSKSKRKAQNVFRMMVNVFGIMT
jgi:cysteinyl-tRNA synthetase